MGVHPGNEGRELGMLVDGGLDGRFLHRKVEVAWAVVLKQSLPEIWADGPIAAERVHIPRRDAALQMSLNVLKVLGLLAVDIAQKVEVEVVLLDFLEAHHAGIFRDF
jgi:hypothetical protein